MCGKKLGGHLFPILRFHHDLDAGVFRLKSFDHLFERFASAVVRLWVQESPHAHDLLSVHGGRSTG